jgi:ATP-binding cassette, subfamily F, member 3
MRPIADVVEEQVRPFDFPSPGKAFGNPLIRLEEASAGYAPDQPVLQGLTLRLDNDDRIGLLGENGNGKSTFAKLIAGRLQPLAGRRLASDKIVVGFFAQHQMEDLPAGKTPYDHILGLMPEATEAQRRARLGAFGFSSDKADTKAENLSGGEKARLLFALATFHRPHLLILDEPTNHLDVDSRQALIMAINEYDGCVILISHDRHLIEACADRLWLVRGGVVSTYDGDLASYRAECIAERQGRNREKGKSVSGAVESAASRAGQRRAAAERRSEVAPLKKRMHAAEKRVHDLGARIADFDRQLGDSGLYASDPGKANALARERGLLLKELAAAEEDWLSAAEAYEGAAGA